ncbi:MAG: hypothetical protein EBR30_20245 [Cytophagia bacterium]|nr:hypothetical protein [Cytophagia bacterium]
MLRLRFDALDSRDNEFYYNGKLFTGIAFETSQGRVLDSVYIQNGVKQRVYLGDYVKVMPGNIRLEVDSEGLEGNPEYEIVKFNRLPYSGILYDFKYEFCIRESSFSHGVSRLSVEWHRNGSLRCYDRFQNGVGDTFEWYNNRQLKSIFTVKVTHVGLSAYFSVYGHLEYLDIANEKFFITNRLVPNYSPFTTIIDINDLASYKIYQKLHLGLSGVTPSVFRVLASNNKLAQLEVFSSLYTSLSDEEFAYVGSLPNIKKILIKDDSGVHAYILKDIKRDHLNLEVKYNDIVLT